jgi:hypothetical protein
MNKTFKLLAATALLCLASVSASAGIINFSFVNDGLLGGKDNSCGAGCVTLSSAGLAQEIGGSGESWLFQGKMKVYEAGSTDLGIGFGSSDLGWSFTDLDGNNSLFGTFTAVGDLLSWSGGGTVSYQVLGGSGLFAGAVGTGLSKIVTNVVDLWGTLIGAFHEEGKMSVLTSTATAKVPEPAVSTMLLAALGMVGFMAYRRRKATTQI